MRKYTTKPCEDCGKPFSCNIRLVNQRTRCQSCINTTRKAKRSALAVPAEDGTFHIPITKGYHAIVDICDSDLAEINWQAVTTSKKHTVYAYGGVYDDERRIVRRPMHQVVYERIIGRKISAGELVDHINRNGLDCRRQNLRLATNTQNSANQRRRITNKSGYKGVSLNKRLGRWRAQLQFNGKKVPLGHYDTPELAHAAYVAKATEMFGEFASDGKPCAED